jgi:AAA domain
MSDGVKEEDYVAPPGEASATKLLWYGNSPPQAPPYLVDETLPETGLAILGGQFGAAKTFVGADLAAAVIVGGEFAAKPVNRNGGVLWLAAEGENEIETRVRAAIIARGGDANDKHPFARQADGVPCLTDKDALERLRTLATEATAHMREAFGCDMTLIAVDTLSAAAGFDDENSASETQKVMNTLAAMARETKTLVVVLDHYGKVADTGVRGSSAKSAAADAILACLGDRDMETGATTNRRMAVTKLRSGPNGRVVAFRLVPTADGLTCTVAWSDAYDVAAQIMKGNPLPKSLRILKRAFDEALGSFGKTTIPRTGMPEVKAVDQDRVREEFFRQYPATNADARKEAHAKGEAFRRGVKDAVERGVLCAINTGPDLAQTILWTP